MSERVTIDKGGRVVIPKPLRQRLGMNEGDLVLIEEDGGALRLRPEPTDCGLVRRGGRLVMPSSRGASKSSMSETLGEIEKLRSRGALRESRGKRRGS